MSGSRHFEKAAHFFTREQFRAGRREGDECPGFVQRQPAAIDNEFKASTEFDRTAAIATQNGSLIFSMWMRP